MLLFIFLCSCEFVFFSLFSLCRNFFRCPPGQTNNPTYTGCINCSGSDCPGGGFNLQCLFSDGDATPESRLCGADEIYCFIQVVLDDLGHAGNHRECTSNKEQCVSGWGNVELYATQTSEIC